MSHVVEVVPVLIARVGDLTFALPIAHVVETHRPMPILDGESVIRGARVPVIDLCKELHAAPPARGIVMKLGDRRVCVLVEEVVGVRSIAAADLARSAPLPQNATRDPDLAGTARVLRLGEA